MKTDMSVKSILFVSLLISAVQLNAQVRVQSNDKHIHYMGRVEQLDSAAVLSWSGTSINLNFSGTGIKAVLREELGDNFYNIIVDGQLIKKLNPVKGKKEYTLAEGLPAGKHSLQLFKRTEWASGKTWFYQFELAKGEVLLAADKMRQRKIEFYGNSITCGMAVEDSTGQDRGAGPYTNNYVSYAALTARHFDAEYYCISKSGIGITVSWFPLIMPEMYDRLDPADAAKKWDFSKYTPDVVVVNLFQNDSWLVKRPEHEQFKARFGNKAPDEQQLIAAYGNFIRSIRSKYKTAKIICALGNMDATQSGSPWPGYIEKAALAMNDKNIYTHFFPYKNTGGHPNVQEQQTMADDLIAFIEANIKW